MPALDEPLWQWPAYPSHYKSPIPQEPHHVQGTWLVKDTSTNGSFVNNVRVGKGNEAPLKVNDVLRLSQAVGEKNKLIECATTAQLKSAMEVTDLLSAIKMLLLANDHRISLLP